MSDIVERLLTVQPIRSQNDMIALRNLIADAAAEIERLRKHLEDFLYMISSSGEEVSFRWSAGRLQFRRPGGHWSDAPTESAAHPLTAELLEGLR